MINWVYGTVEELWLANNQSYFNEPNSKVQQIKNDLKGHYFLGSKPDALHHIKLWNSTNPHHAYTQGNMSAKNLQLFMKRDEKISLGKKGKESLRPFQKKDEEEGEYQKHFKYIDFAYVDQEGVLCGLGIYYRDDCPSQWTVGLIKNTQKEDPKDRQVFLFSNVDLLPYVNTTETGLQQEYVPFNHRKSVNPLIKHCKHPFVEGILARILTPEEPPKINLNVARVAQLLRRLDTSNPSLVIKDPVDLNAIDLDLLFQKHDAMDSIIQVDRNTPDELKIKLPFSMIKSWFKKKIELKNDEQESIDFLKQSFTLEGVKDWVSNNVLSQIDEVPQKDDDSDYLPLISIIESIALTQNEKVNKALLSMHIAFYEEGIWSTHQTFLKKHLIDTVDEKSCWNEQQIRVAARLVNAIFDKNKKTYNTDLLFMILTNEQYYQCADLMRKQRLLTQDSCVLWNDEEKLKHLIYINGLEDDEIKTVCIEFWVREQYKSIDVYTGIVTQLQKNELYPKTVLTLFYEGIRADKIKAMIDENRLQAEVIFSQHADIISLLNISRDKIEQFDANVLVEISASFSTLKETYIEASIYFQLAAQNDASGYKFRLFLKQLKEVSNIADRKILIEMLYKGIEQTIEDLNRFVAQVDTQTELFNLAQEFQKSFMCVTTLEDLEFKDLEPKKLVINKELVINFALIHTGECAENARFRMIVLKIEEQLRRIEASHSETMVPWGAAQIAYKQTVYALIYTALNDKNFDIKPDLLLAEEALLLVADPAIKSQLIKALIIVFNIIIAGLTSGIANIVKYKYTGNPLFFNQSRNGELIRELDRDIINTLTLSP
jgi:hypothetical protein